MLRKQDRGDILERIAYLITSGKIDEELFDFYFAGTEVGNMNYEELLHIFKVGQND